MLHDQIPELLRLRKERGLDRPLIVWEPFPPECNPSQKAANIAAFRLVDVFSPNHLELVAFFKESPSEDDADPKTLEKYAAIFLESGIGPKGEGIVLVRAGGKGCLLAHKSGDEKLFNWLPPYFDSSERVVDATGAGNTFLGALAFAMACRASPLEAAVQASVATSFSLEQVGLPSLEVKVVDGAELELWNGSGLEARQKEYRSKLAGRMN
jgi:sugar/nucleoside kinase (ribokinase family)